MTDPATPAPRILGRIVERHFDEAVDLWPARDRATAARQLRLENLADVDARLDAHLDGLRIARDHEWHPSHIPADLSDPGEAFVRTVLALESREPETLEALLEAAQAAPPILRAVVSAFGWTSPPLLAGTVKELLASAVPFKRQVGLAACAVHRVDPGDSLWAAIDQDDGGLRRRACRAVGELGLTHLVGLLMGQPHTSEADSSFWASWSTVLAGGPERGLEDLSDLTMEEGWHRMRGMPLLLQAMTAAQARAWLSQLRGRAGDQSRDLITGAGLSGDPSYVPWVIGQMAVPAVARAAGEAFSMVVGIELRAARLSTARPPEVEASPTDDPDDGNVAMDPDDELPWPDPQKIERWWAANAGRFQQDTRYFVGQPVTPEHCTEILKSGYQRQRLLAAQYLCLLNPGTPLFNTCAPAWRQQRLLAQM